MDSAKLLLLSLLLFWHQTSSGSHDTLAANESISDGSLVISRGGRFALGFFSPGSSSYRYLGIWYHDIGEQTVVWVANRNDPITGTSGILTGHGYCSLFLYSNSSSKLPIWSANVSAGSNGTCVAQLLDSGNFVLKEGASKSTTLWQSFDYPSDTVLPGMKIGLSRRTGSSSFLTSWRSADDPGIGNFSYKLKPSASPQLFMYQGTIPYWRGAPWQWERWEDNHEFYKDSFVDNDDGIFLSSATVDSSLLVRAVVDPSGILTAMTRDESDGQWRVFYSSPKQKCDFYGSCGPNSKCDPGIVFPFECACLPGYEPRYPRMWHLRDGSGGCVRKRLESSSICRNGEGFVRVGKVKLPDTSAAIWVDLGRRKLTCEGECRKNCSCSAYATMAIDGKGIGCLTWYGTLIDTVNYPVRAYDLYVRVDAIELGTIMTISKDRVKPSPVPDSWRLSEIFATGVVLGGYLALMTVAFFWLAYETNFFTKYFHVTSFQQDDYDLTNKAVADQLNQQLASALYLQISTISQALIFVTRSRGWSFQERPGFLLVFAFLVAQLIATVISAEANWKFAGIRSIGWKWTGAIWAFNAVTYVLLDPIKFIVMYALSGRAWGLVVDKRTAFTNKKDFGREEREAAWATEQRTLHGLQSDSDMKIFSDKSTYREISLMAEEARKRAEIARMRELHTLKGRVESFAKLKGYDIDSMNQHYTL